MRQATGLCRGCSLMGHVGCKGMRGINQQINVLFPHIVD
jgi:hypothetical protein